MTDYSKFISARPVNKTASRVVARGYEHGEDERATLLRELSYLDAAILSAKKHKNLTKQQMLELGRKKFKVQTKLTALRGATKRQGKRNIHNHFMDVCRENMHPLQFMKFKTMARERAENGLPHGQTDAE